MIPANRTASKRMKMHPLLGWIIAVTALHFLISLIMMYLSREDLRYAALPSGPGWFSFLASGILTQPAFLCHRWPVAFEQLIVWLFLQSVLCGLFCVLPLQVIFTGKKVSVFHRIAQYVIAPFTVVIFLFFSQFVMFILALLFGGGMTYDVFSNNLPAHTNKMGWVTRHLSPPAPGPILATEFRFHVLCGGIGPSTDLSIVAVKVPPCDIPLWIDSTGLEPCKDAGVKDPFLLRDPAWRRTSPPEYYAAGEAVVAVYRKEGIIIFDQSFGID